MGQYGFSSVNLRFGTKKSNDTKNFFRQKKEHLSFDWDTKEWNLKHFEEPSANSCRIT
jgi:hypothetical protein